MKNSLLFLGKDHLEISDEIFEREKREFLKRIDTIFSVESLEISSLRVTSSYYSFLREKY